MLEFYLQNLNKYLNLKYLNFEYIEYFVFGKITYYTYVSLGTKCKTVSVVPRIKSDRSNGLTVKSRHTHTHTHTYSLFYILYKDNYLI